MIFYLLTVANENNWSNSLSIVGQFFRIVFTLIIVIALTIVIVRLFSKSSYKRSRSSNLRVIESVGVGYQTVIQLIKAGDKFFLVGVSKERITLLSEIDESGIDLSEPEPIQFDKYLYKFKKKDNQSDE